MFMQVEKKEKKKKNNNLYVIKLHTDNNKFN